MTVFLLAHTCSVFPTVNAYTGQVTFHKAPETHMYNFPPCKKNCLIFERKKKKITWFFFDYIHTAMLLVPLILNLVVDHLCMLNLWYNARCGPSMYA